MTSRMSLWTDRSQPARAMGVQCSVMRRSSEFGTFRPIRMDDKPDRHTQRRSGAHTTTSRSAAAVTHREEIRRIEQRAARVTVRHSSQLEERAQRQRGPTAEGEATAQHGSAPTSERRWLQRWRLHCRKHSAAPLLRHSRVAALREAMWLQRREAALSSCGGTERRDATKASSARSAHAARCCWPALHRRSINHSQPSLVTHCCAACVCCMNCVGGMSECRRVDAPPASALSHAAPQPPSAAPCPAAAAPRVRLVALLPRHSPLPSPQSRACDPSSPSRWSSTCTRAGARANGSPTSRACSARRAPSVRTTSTPSRRACPSARSSTHSRRRRRCWARTASPSNCPRARRALPMWPRRSPPPPPRRSSRAAADAPSASRTSMSDRNRICQFPHALRTRTHMRSLAAASARPSHSCSLPLPLSPLLCVVTSQCR